MLNTYISSYVIKTTHQRRLIFQKKVISNRDIYSILKVEENITKITVFKIFLSQGPHFLKVKFLTMITNTTALLNYVINYSLSRSKRRTNQQHFSLSHPSTFLGCESVGTIPVLVTSASGYKSSFTDHCSLKCRQLQSLECCPNLPELSLVLNWELPLRNPLTSKLPYL